MSTMHMPLCMAKFEACASRFTGKERDAESGLDYFGARYMSSSMGRFMSPDSSGYSGLTNPQSWNLYAYTLNNPLRYDDPTGHTVENACSNQAACTAAVGAATGSAEAASHVTSTTTTTDHSFLGIHWTTSTTTIGVTGIDMASFRGLSENANKLADLIESKQNFTVDISNTYLQYDRQGMAGSGLLNTTALNPDFTQTPSMTGNNDGNVFVRWDPGKYDQESRDEHIPTANTARQWRMNYLGISGAKSSEGTWREPPLTSRML
jgi:RHS repeat-associated protein